MAKGRCDTPARKYLRPPIAEIACSHQFTGRLVRGIAIRQGVAEPEGGMTPTPAPPLGCFAMLFHASFPAQQPARAADAVARLWHGRSFPFPAFPNSYIALKGDAYGSAVEFYPAGQVLVPGPEEVEAVNMLAGRPSESHLAIATDLSEAEVQALAAEYGWMSRTCRRGDAFRVIEFWIEDAFLIEVLTPDMQAEYLAFMTPECYDAFLTFTRAAALQAKVGASVLASQPIQ